MSSLFFCRLTVASECDAFEGGGDVVVLNQIFTRLHRGAHGINYGISLPELTALSTETEANLGSTMQIFCSSKQDLQTLMEIPSLRRLLRDYCTVSPIRAVLPNMILGWERYARDRSTDKHSPAAMRRAQSRLNRGICVINRSSNPAAITFGPQHPCFDHMSVTTAASGTEGRSLKIFVKRITGAKPGDFSFDSFGLSRDSSAKESKNHGSVPILRQSGKA